MVQMLSTKAYFAPKLLAAMAYKNCLCKSFLAKQEHCSIFSFLSMILSEGEF